MVGIEGRDRVESGGPVVTLNLCVMRQYYLGERDLVPTSPLSSYFLRRTTARPKIKKGIHMTSHYCCACHPTVYVV